MAPDYFRDYTEQDFAARQPRPQQRYKPDSDSLLPSPIPNTGFTRLTPLHRQEVQLHEDTFVSNSALALAKLSIENAEADYKEKPSKAAEAELKQAYETCKKSETEHLEALHRLKQFQHVKYPSLLPKVQSEDDFIGKRAKLFRILE